MNDTILHYSINGMNEVYGVYDRMGIISDND